MHPHWVILSGFVIAAGFEYMGEEKAFRDLLRAETAQAGIHPN